MSEQKKAKKVQFGKNTIVYIPNVSKIYEFKQVPPDKLNDMNRKIGRSENFPLFHFVTEDGPEGELSEKYVYSEENLEDLSKFVGSKDLELVFTSSKGKLFNGEIRRVRNIPRTDPERRNQNKREGDLRGKSSTVEGEIPVKGFIDTDFIPRIDFSKPNDTYDGVIPGITIESVVPADNQEDIRKKAFPERVGEIKKLLWIMGLNFGVVKISDRFN